MRSCLFRIVVQSFWLSFISVLLPLVAKPPSSRFITLSLYFTRPHYVVLFQFISSISILFIWFICFNRFINFRFWFIAPLISRSNCLDVDRIVASMKFQFFWIFLSCCSVCFCFLIILLRNIYLHLVILRCHLCSSTSFSYTMKLRILLQEQVFILSEFTFQKFYSFGFLVP